MAGKKINAFNELCKDIMIANMADTLKAYGGFPELEKIAYTSDEFSIPRMQLYVRDRHVCCSCSVEGTYHIDNDDMEPLFTVLFDMITDGILEKAEV